jgi:MYXO-CTERM domain-containing protein
VYTGPDTGLGGDDTGLTIKHGKCGCDTGDDPRSWAMIVALLAFTVRRRR